MRVPSALFLPGFHMCRLVAGLLPLIALSGTASAQDMPLFTFALDGEGWRKVGEAADSPRPKPEPLSSPHPEVSDPTAVLVSRDGGTVYYGTRSGQHLWAFPVNKDGQPVSASGAKYAPLRLHKGEKSLAVTSLLTDSDGRIYAGTPDGIQVFDPTGRLSGVLLLPAKGSPEELRWDGSELTVWIGGQKYARKMNAKGIQ